MPSPLKNPAVTYMLIMLITVPLVSPCFWALVRCLLDVSPRLKSRSANASFLTVQLLQCFLPHDEAQPPFHLLRSQFSVHFAPVLMTLCYSLRVGGHSICFIFTSAAMAARLTSEPEYWTKGIFTSPQFILYTTQGLVKQYTGKVTNVHLAIFRRRSQSVARPGGLCNSALTASPLQTVPLFSWTFHLSSNLQVSPHEQNVQGTNLPGRDG